MEEIKKRLLQVSMASIFGQAVVMGANINLPGTIQMIKDQLKDNRELVTDIIGSDCVGLIEAAPMTQNPC